MSEDYLNRFTIDRVFSELGVTLAMEGLITRRRIQHDAGVVHGLYELRDGRVLHLESHIEDSMANCMGIFAAAYDRELLKNLKYEEGSLDARRAIAGYQRMRVPFNHEILYSSLDERFNLDFDVLEVDEEISFDVDDDDDDDDGGCADFGGSR